MKYTCGETAHVYFTVRDYTPDMSLADFSEMTEQIRTRSKHLEIHFDMEGVGPNMIEHFGSMSKLVSDVIEYTKDDGLLRRVEITQTGFIFKLLYRPISLLLPKEIRDLVVIL